MINFILTFISNIRQIFIESLDKQISEEYQKQYKILSKMYSKGE